MTKGGDGCRDQLVVHHLLNTHLRAKRFKGILPETQGQSLKEFHLKILPGNQGQSLKEFYLKTKARIWP